MGWCNIFLAFLLARKCEYLGLCSDSWFGRLAITVAGVEFLLPLLFLYEYLYAYTYIYTH